MKVIVFLFFQPLSKEAALINVLIKKVVTVVKERLSK